MDYITKYKASMAEDMAIRRQAYIKLLEKISNLEEDIETNRHIMEIVYTEQNRSIIEAYNNLQIYALYNVEKQKIEKKIIELTNQLTLLHEEKERTIFIYSIMIDQYNIL